MRNLVLTACSVLFLAPGSLAGQTWGATFEIGGSHYGGHGHSSGSGEELRAFPEGVSTLGFQLDRQGEKIGFGVGLLVASGGVVVEDEMTAVVAKDVLKLVEIAPEISLVVLRPGEARVRVHAGVVLDRWSPDGDETRSTLGALAAVSLQVPFSSRIAVRVRYEGTVTGSLFDESDLPPELERGTGYRRRYAVGIRFGF